MDDGRWTREAAQAWLTAFGADESDPAARGVAFAPTTYKTVLDGALTLGRAAGRFPEAMRVVGEGEARLRRLRDRLGLERGDRAGDGLPRVAVLARLDPLTVAGRWVPDLVAHAGGRPVLVAPGDPDRFVSTDDLIATAPEVLVVLGDESGDARRLVPGARVHHAPPSLYLRPGPTLIGAAEALADVLRPPPPAEPEGSPRR